MEIIKKLHKGDYSLAVTFWGFYTLGNFIFFALILLLFLAVLSIDSNYALVVPVIIIMISVLCLLNFIYNCLTVIGVFRILRQKITFWRVVAFIYITICMIYGVYSIMMEIDYSIVSSIFAK